MRLGDKNWTNLKEIKWCPLWETFSMSLLSLNILWLVPWFLQKILVRPFYFFKIQLVVLVVPYKLSLITDNECIPNLSWLGTAWLNLAQLNVPIVLSLVIWLPTWILNGVYSLVRRFFVQILLDFFCNNKNFVKSEFKNS